ncbi:MAG TPA: type II toxin-antitoxin system RelE/ParE family toxin [Rubrivivax sp.]|nr:type II toxin-antitoxin system RelE/ParE family toxin [Rubrivivax sp.]
MYAIDYTRDAVHALARMPRNLRQRVVSKIENLARDPFGAANVKQLVGQPGYRLRVGDWRVIYDVEQGRLLVRVLRIAPRGGAYE